jgi:hypothetical protein
LSGENTEKHAAAAMRSESIDLDSCVEMIYYSMARFYSQKTVFAASAIASRRGEWPALGGRDRCERRSGCGYPLIYYSAANLLCDFSFLRLGYHMRNALR